MALNKDKKAQIVEEVSELLGSSKLTVMAKYTGTSVKALQDLRAQAKDSDTKIKVVKNRLIKKALESDKRFEAVDKTVFSGQLIYAFNSNDEVVPAQVLNNFAKTQSQLEFVGALATDGALLSAEEVKHLASLPSKQQLQAQLVGTIQAPISGFVNILAGNLRGFLNALNGRASLVN